jgi:hypothetical protein
VCNERAAVAQSPEEGRITFLGVFACASLEATFQKRHQRFDLWLSRVCVIAATMRVALFLFADYGIYGSSNVLPYLFACRCLFVLYSGWVLTQLRQKTAPPLRERVLFTWCVLLGALTVAFSWARPPGYAGMALMTVGLVLSAYCVLPLPLSYQGLLAVAFSLASFGVALLGPMTNVFLVAFGGAFVMANVLGAVVSWRLHHHRRLLFLGAMHETELRVQLEQALAEVKTLRGVLSICAWCKRIRNESEAWQRVEDYVQAHSDAQFTHGICPQCLGDQLHQNATCPSTERTAKMEKQEASTELKP